MIPNEVTHAAVPEKVTYDDHVLPIFREHCLACHDQGGRSGDLALDSYNAALAGGAGGEVVDAGAGGDSRLYRLMAHLDKPIMPPGQDKVGDEKLELVKAWIDGGLLENAGSKAKKSGKPAVAAFVPSADNRPSGEPAMPNGFYREPVVYADRMGAVADVAASPWAPLVAVTGQHQVMLYHADTRELLAVVPFVVGMPEVVRFSRNGDLLLVAGGRGAALGVAHVWDIRSGARIAEIGDELDTILAADIRADHALVAIAGPRKRVQVLRTSDGSQAYGITKHTDWVTALEFSPDGKHLVTADRAGNAHVWESATGRPVADLAGHKAVITAVSWRGDSGLIATASDDGEIRTWQPGGTQVKQWAAGGGVQDLEFTKSGQIASIGRDRFGKLWDAEGKEIRRYGPTDDIGLAVASTHDGDDLVLGDWTGAVKIVNRESGEIVGEVSTNPPTLDMRLSATEQELAAALEQVSATKAALAAVTAKLESGNAAVERYRAEKQEHNEAVAMLLQQRQVQQAMLAERRVAVDELDKAIAAIHAEQQVVESVLSGLKQSLASIGNQDGEEADASSAGQLEADIVEKQSALEDILARKSEAEGKRPELAKSQEAVERQIGELAKQIDEHKQKLQVLEANAANLPDVEALGAERDRLQAELNQARVTRLDREQTVDDLKAERDAYGGATATLSTKMAEQQLSLETRATELELAKQRLQAELADVATVAHEIDDLQQRIAALEGVRKKLAATAETSKMSVGNLQQQIEELSGERAKIEKTLADLQSAAELRQQLTAGD